MWQARELGGRLLGEMDNGEKTHYLRTERGSVSGEKGKGRHGQKGPWRILRRRPLVDRGGTGAEGRRAEGFLQRGKGTGYCVHETREVQQGDDYAEKKNSCSR